MKRHHVGVFSCSVCFLHPLMHAKHEKTPVLVSFRAQHPKGGPDRESRTEGWLVSPCGDPLKFFLEIT